MTPIRYKRYDDVLGFVVNRASFSLRKSLARRFRDAGIDMTAEEFAVMNRIAEADGRSQREVSELTFKDRPAISRAVARLCNAGLIEVRPAKNDRRINRLYLSDAGRSLRFKLLELADENMSYAERGILASELETTRRVLQRLWRNLQEEDK